MTPQEVELIRQHPDFIQLVRRKQKLYWSLSLAMLVIYYGFVIVVAAAMTVSVAVMAIAGVVLLPGNGLKRLLKASLFLSVQRWYLSLAMLVIYYGFVLLVAFSPSTLGQSLSGGVTTVGMLVGVVIVGLAFALTGFYVYRANNVIDPLNEKLKQECAR